MSKQVARVSFEMILYCRVGFPTKFKTPPVMLCVLEDFLSQEVEFSANFQSEEISLPDKLAYSYET